MILLLSGDIDLSKFRSWGWWIPTGRKPPTSTFKAGLSPFKNCFYEIMKNGFYLMRKALFILQIFTFLSWLFGYVEKRLDNIASGTGQQIIAIHILPNISRSKGNQGMKFDQLMQYNIRNIFSGKSHTKCYGEASPRPFYKKIKISGWTVWNVIKCFYCMS